MKTRYKLTNQLMQTYGEHPWTLGKWQKTTGHSKLGSPGWLHCYTDPVLAVMLNPIHTHIAFPRLFRVQCDGQTRLDRGLRCGFTRMKLVEELPVPVVTLTSRIKFTIRCAIEAGADYSIWLAWALLYADGTDRATATAQAVRRLTMDAVHFSTSAASEGAARAMTAAAWAASRPAISPLAPSFDGRVTEIIVGHGAEAAARTATLDLPAIARWAVSKD